MKVEQKSSRQLKRIAETMGHWVRLGLSQIVLTRGDFFPTLATAKRPLADEISSCC
jgi:hypothetical protein